MPLSLATRSTPGGVKLEDGYQSLIAFAADADVSFFEKSIKPPGIDNGDPIDQTTMWNTDVITKASQALDEITEVSGKVAYDPEVYDQIMALSGVEGVVTVYFPDGSAISFFGYLRKFEPDEMERGKQPEASITVVITNVDPSDGSEVVPDYYPAASVP